MVAASASFSSPYEPPEEKNVASLLHKLGHDHIPAHLISRFLTRAESRPITGTCKQILLDRRILRFKYIDGEDSSIYSGIYKGIEPSLLKGMHTISIVNRDQYDISIALRALIRFEVKPERIIFEFLQGSYIKVLSSDSVPDERYIDYLWAIRSCKKLLVELLGEGYEKLSDTPYNPYNPYNYICKRKPAA